MDLDIDEVLSNYEYYIDGLNITEDGFSIHEALMKAKQISLECQDLDKSWYVNKSIDKEAHVRRMCEIPKELNAVLKTRSLQEIWKRNLSNLEFKPNENLSIVNEAKWRKRDLSADISHFYAYYEDDTRLYIDKFKSVILLKTFTQYEISVKYFCKHVVNLVKTMNDIDERIADLMYLVDPSPRYKLIWKTPPHTQASLISDRLKIVAKRFELDFASKVEFDEFCRLNRRMFVLIKYAEFTKFSKRDENRYDLIRRLSLFKVDIEGEDPVGDGLVKVVEMLKTLNCDINKYRQFAMTGFMPQWLKVKNSDDHCSFENLHIMKENSNFLSKIPAAFQHFMNRFVEIRKLMNEVWNIL